MIAAPTSAPQDDAPRERVSRRQPLNFDAPDLRAAAAFSALPLRDEIDHWRSEVQRRRNRLDDAIRLAGMRFVPAGCPVDTPESAGIAWRRAMTVLHYLLELARLRGEEKSA